MLKGFSVLILLFLSIACVQQSGGGKVRSALTNGTSINPTAAPTPYTNAANFISIGSTQTSSIVSLPSSFTDSMSILGNQINYYLNGTLNSSTVQCLVASYPTNPDNKIGVFAAIPMSFFNFATNQKEYYYQVQPAEKNLNQTNCQTTGIISNLLSIYPGKTAVYRISDICTSCTTPLTSSGLQLYSVSGSPITAIDVVALRIQINTVPTSTGSGLTCTSSANCISTGYDCCIEGQCVDDGQTKSSVSVPANVLTEITNNPSTYRNYPQYYYVCPTYVPTPTPTPDPTAQAQANIDAILRQERLEELYNCTKAVTDDEVAICTATWDNIKASVVAAGPSGVNFSSSNDDLNFKTLNTLMASYNITEIKYADELLYKQSTSFHDTSRISFVVGTENDSLSSGQMFVLKGAPTATTPPHDKLKVKYKIDGSCERINSSFAKCKKFYTQGQVSSPAKPSDHSSGQTFKLPIYVDTGYAITVKVNGLMVPSSSTTWTLTGTNITFDSSYIIYNGQKVEITYYVTGGNASAAVLSKYAAITEINSYCANSSNNTCGTGDCSLTPTYQSVNGTQTIVGYQCLYPQPNVAEPPMQQTVYISSKSVPHRYFDSNGVAYDVPDGSTGTQEGTAFSYTNNNLVKPSNLTSYTGINEILGSMKGADATSAKPAKMVAVKKGKLYDIWTEAGSYSPCPNCGFDYYSSLQKLFPDNFQYNGGGVMPSYAQASRLTNTTRYRPDDMLFGRACFIPVTMIPWTHVANSSSSQVQRQNRLRAQHALFSNGYQRDWYGFDYGALIGSFDGVTWFAVGNQRRVTAQTGKLFLAVNAHYGDLANTSSYTATITEVTNFTSNGGSQVTQDGQSDGAECQKYHICTTDNDCITRLGYEYSCQAVSSITTSWPVFNSNAEELAGQALTKTLTSVVGGISGGSKRCVYRAQGAPCTRNYDTATTSYSGTTTFGINSCNPNYYCETLGVSKFNDRIARYGRSPANVNSDTANTTDTFGLAAKILGRPLNFNGSSSIDSTAKTILQTNQVTALCIPGKEPSTTLSMAVINKTTPSSKFGDKILGIGTTSSSLSAADLGYVAQCAATDTSGNYLHNGSSTSTLAATSSSIYAPAAAQNIPTNSLAVAAGTIADVGASVNLFTSSSGINTQMGVQRNSCLRAPGSTCFSDFECAPNKWTSQKFANIDQDEFKTAFSEAEYKFWSEPLICSQDKDPVADIATYDVKNNRCCREVGKTLTTFYDGYLVDPSNTNPIAWADHKVLNTHQAPGTDIALNNSARYSRTVTSYDDTVTNGTTYPKLAGFITNSPGYNGTNTSTTYQYNTLHEVNSKTCCTKNWVRSFASDNGGGHKWAQGKLQGLDKGILKYLSWSPKVTGSSVTYSCTDLTAADIDYYENPGCEINNFSPSQEKTYLEWFGLFELTGVPQILIPTDSSGVQITIDDDQVALTSATNMPSTTFTGSTISATLIPTPTASIQDMPNKVAANLRNNFDTAKVKNIFSDREFNCCIDSEKTNLPNTVTSDMCCTGTKHATENRCCLPDWTDVTVYLNRYVSSEGAGLSSSSYDSQTGYIKDAGAVMILAQAKGAGKSICCSGKMAYGAVIGDYKIPGAESKDKTKRYFTYGPNGSDPKRTKAASAYDAGVRWNNHVYCVNDSYEDPHAE